MARWDALVSPISKTEVAILGGWNSGYVNFGYILNTLDMTIEKIYQVEERDPETSMFCYDESEEEKEEEIFSL